MKKVYGTNSRNSMHIQHGKRDHYSYRKRDHLFLSPIRNVQYKVFSKLQVGLVDFTELWIKSCNFGKCLLLTIMI